MATYHGVSLKEKLTFLRYTFRPVPLFFAGCVLLTLLLHLTINKPSVENGETSQVIKNLQQSNTQCPQCPQAWHDAKFTTEYALLDAVYGKIFGGEAIDNLADKIPKWAEIKADELNSNFALKTTDVVLDLGCGPGFIAHAVKQIVNQGKVICFDVNRDMNEYARSKHGSALEYSLVNAAVDPTIVGKPLSSLPDNYLDVFYSFAVFIHHDMYMFTAYFEGLAQKMKLGGHVYLQYLASEHFNPNDPTFREHFHIWQNDLPSGPWRCIITGEWEYFVWLRCVELKRSK